jgi:flagellar hook-basal body complex protein FliE
VIPPISSIPALPSPPVAAPTTSAPSGGVVSAVGDVFDALAHTQSIASADEAATAAGQGSLTDTMIAATEASLQTEVTTSVMDKALEAYSSVVQMTF